MQACCLSGLTFVAVAEVVSTVCVNSLWCLIFSYYFPTLCVCIHSRLYPLCICVNSACVDPACLCCLCWPCSGLCHFDVSLSLVGVSAHSACAHSLCLCELAVFVPTLSFCTLCDFLPTLCLCVHSYFFVPTMCLCPPSCCLSAHSGVHSACVVCVYSLRCLRPLCFCPHCCGLWFFVDSILDHKLWPFCCLQAFRCIKFTHLAQHPIEPYISILYSTHLAKYSLGPLDLHFLVDPTFMKKMKFDQSATKKYFQAA